MHLRGNDHERVCFTERLDWHKLKTPAKKVNKKLTKDQEIFFPLAKRDRCNCPRVEHYFHLKAVQIVQSSFLFLKKGFEFQGRSVATDRGSPCAVQPLSITAKSIYHSIIKSFFRIVFITGCKELSCSRQRSFLQSLRMFGRLNTN